MVSDYFLSILNYSFYCVVAPLYTDGCHEFWFYGKVTFECACFVFMIFLIYQIIVSWFRMDVSA